MKKIYSIILALAMVSTTVSMTFATTSYDVSENNQDMINTKSINLEKVYSNMGFEIVDVVKSENAAEMTIVAEDLDGGEVVDTIQAYWDESGNYIQEIREGDKYNEVMITSEGKVFVDNVLVSDASLSGSNSSVTPYAARKNVWSKSCPYSTASYYTKLYSTNNKSNISLQKNLTEFTIAALCTVVASAIFPEAIIAADVLSDIMSSYLIQVRNSNPQGRALSVKDSVYTHLSGNGRVDTRTYVYKHSTIYYAYANYSYQINSSPAISYNLIVTN